MEHPKLFRDRGQEKRGARKMRGVEQTVRVAFGDGEIPEYREQVLTVYPSGLAVRKARGSEGRTLFGVTHVGTGYAVGPTMENREEAVEICYLLRDLDWHFDRRGAVTDEAKCRSEQAVGDVLGPDAWARRFERA